MAEQHDIKTRSKWLTVISAFLLPGAGHWVAGSYGKGLLLLSGFLLDLFTLIRLAEWNGGKHLLVIVYLGLLLPIFYYFSVFGALQTLEKPQPKQSILPVHGIALVIMGILLIFLVNPQHWTREVLEGAASWLTGIIPIVIGILLALPTEEQRSGSYRLGRYTSAIFFIALGILGLMDSFSGHSYFTELPSFWPYLIVALGLEMVIYSMLNKSRRKLSVQLSGLFCVLLTASAAYLVTQYSDLPERFLEQFQVQPMVRNELGEQKGFYFDKPLKLITADDALSSIKLLNTNGDVSVETADVEQIEISSRVWIDVENEQEASEAAEQAELIVEEGEKLIIETKSAAYSADKKIPRYDVHITLPLSFSNRWTPDVQSESPVEEQETGTSGNTANDTESPADLNDDHANQADLADQATANQTDASDQLDDLANLTDATDRTADLADPTDATDRTADLDSPTSTSSGRQIALKIDVQNGAVVLQDLRMTKGVAINLDSGDVKGYRISADKIQIKVNSGTINIDQVIGDSILEAKNGLIEGTDLSGEVYAKATNGNVSLSRVERSIEAETKNGNIDIAYAADYIKADTLNGNISVMSPIVKGDWDLDSSVGEIITSLPQNGSYAVHGSVAFGTITTELPLEIVRKTVRGKIGAGTYRIRINATNSITIKALPV